MQVTNLQVERSLEALGQQDRADEAEPRRSHSSAEVPPGLLELLSNAPAVRLDRLLDAKRRLDAGQTPSDQDLANRLVGRMVCDRLR